MQAREQLDRVRKLAQNVKALQKRREQLLASNSSLAGIDFEIERNQTEYRADIKKYCLLALRRHFTHVDGIMPCDDCPWEGQTAQYEPCDLIFLDELSDILRTYPDDESRRLADQLEICKKYDYDICSTCKYFNPCYTDEDLTPMLNEVFLHLHRHGVC